MRYREKCVRETGYLFSVVMAIYNTEKYLKEAVDSLLNQTVGFTDNIQLIMVNDGSSDNCDEICREYAEAYPDNIIYVKKTNGGVSSARNEGLKYVKGKYVNFLDPDDKWAEDAFANALGFFYENPGINILSCRLCFFEAQEGFRHHLDYRYKQTDTINILEKYDQPQMSMSSAFILTELIGDLKLDERLESSEDIPFMSWLIMKQQKYGVIREAVYYYRKRKDKTSAIDNHFGEKSGYFNVLIYAYRKIMDMSISIYGYVIPYVQYLVITDLQWRLEQKIPDFFSNEEKEKYKGIIIELLRDISDEVIMKQRRMSLFYKSYAMNLKYGASEFDKSGLAGLIKITCVICCVKNGMIHMEGITDQEILGDDYSVNIDDGSGYIYPLAFKRADFLDSIKMTMDGEVLLKRKWFTVDIPLRTGAKYRFIISDGDDFRRKAKLKFGKFSIMANIPKSYFVANDHIVKKINNEVRVYAYRFKTYIATRHRYEKTMRERGKTDLIRLRRKAVKLKKKSRPIWIISDRTIQARDNGEALFRYLMNINATEKYDIYFMLEKDSPDFARMQTIGKVLEFNSEEYKIKFLAASKIISAAADEWTCNPFGRDREYMSNLFDFDFVFLQHGIIKDDLSGWLNKKRQNIALFVTSALREKQSINEDKYGYDDSVVKLTGMPRYDDLTSESMKLVTILPTWRKNLAGAVSRGSSARDYADSFRETEYCRFYNGMINDKRLLDAMKENGYKGQFIVHPAIYEQSRDFHGNDTICIWDGLVDYQKVFRESALIVTDYSSIAFDFAYLKKPLIYSQFDADTIYEDHVYSGKGYYSYDKDGFGPVCRNYEDTVNAIIDSIKKGCPEPEMYRKRAEDFFAHTDTNNCRRVYEEIVKLDENIFDE